MTQHQGSWPQGTPCWVDLMAKDIEATKDFYAAVLGWTFTEPAAEFGGYLNALVESEAVAGLSPTMPGMEQTPNLWTVYLASDDLEASAAAVTEAEGSVLAKPMTLGELGAMALFADPGGGVVGAWQAGTHTGFDVVDVDGAVVWCDLMTSDLDTAKDFYARVFGFIYGDSQADVSEDPYLMYSVPGGDRPAGGLGALPAQTQPVWSVCFATDDVDDAARRVADAGGSVLAQPYDFAYGRLVGVTGPDGEPFATMSSDDAA